MQSKVNMIMNIFIDALEKENINFSVTREGGFAFENPRTREIVIITEDEMQRIYNELERKNKS